MLKKSEILGLKKKKAFLKIYSGMSGKTWTTSTIISKLMSNETC